MSNEAGPPGRAYSFAGVSFTGSGTAAAHAAVLGGLAGQARAGAMINACLNVSACTGVTVWGIDDGSC